MPAALAGVDPETAIIQRANVVDGGLQADIDTGTGAFCQQHVENVFGAVAAEKLAGLFFHIRDAVALGQGQKIPWRVACQRRFDKVRVSAQVIGRCGIQVGEIAASAARHQDFLAGLVGMVQHQHMLSAMAGCLGAKQPGSTSANDDYVGVLHDGQLSISGWVRRAAGPWQCR